MLVEQRDETQQAALTLNFDLRWIRSLRRQRASGPSARAVLPCRGRFWIASKQVWDKREEIPEIPTLAARQFVPSQHFQERRAVRFASEQLAVRAEGAVLACYAAPWLGP